MLPPAMATVPVRLFRLTPWVGLLVELALVSVRLRALPVEFSAAPPVAFRLPVVVVTVPAELSTVRAVPAPVVTLRLPRLIGAALALRLTPAPALGLLTVTPPVKVALPPAGVLTMLIAVPLTLPMFTVPVIDQVPLTASSPMPCRLPLATSTSMKLPLSVPLVRPRARPTPLSVSSATVRVPNAVPEIFVPAAMASPTMNPRRVLPVPRLRQFATAQVMVGALPPRAGNALPAIGVMPLIVARSLPDP